MPIPDDVVARIPLPVTPQLRRLLEAAEAIASKGGAAAVLDCANALSPDDLRSAAELICERADRSPHPHHVVEACARFIIESGQPMLPPESLAGVAALAAADCRTKLAKDAAVATVREQLSAGRRLRQTDEWKAFVAGGSGATVSQEARLRSIREVLGPAEVGELLQTSGDGGTPEAEMRAILHVLARYFDEVTDRNAEWEAWRRLLCKRMTGQPSGPWADTFLQQSWIRADRAAAEQELRRRYDETGQVDDRLWRLLVPKRNDSTPEPSAWSALLAHLIRSEVEKGRWPRDLFYPWQLADPAAMRDFLLACEPESLDPRWRAGLVRGLIWVGVNAAGRLRQIQALGGRDAEEATVALELIGELPSDRMEALAALWRRTRRAEDLFRLYHTYIDRLFEGAPFDAWLNRLGEDPATFDRGGAWITPVDAEGGSLYLELDSAGRLMGTSFK